MKQHRLPPWLRPKSANKQMALAAGWYDEEQWTLVKAESLDPERFEETYPEWVKMAEKALADLRAQGIHVTRHKIAAADLLAWCLAHGKPNNAASRAEYVTSQQPRGPLPKNDA